MSTPNPSTGSSPAVPANRRIPIHHIKPEEAAAAKRAEEDPDVTAYSYEGHGAEVPAGSPKAAAKVVRGVGQPRYSAKHVTTGMCRGHLYNPLSPSYSIRDQYEWKPVTKAAFDLYLRFLQTHNVVYARQAGRAN
jgi:hypothetical protein